jgi:glycosyltransferase involved in cell wall biosynthesis
MNSKRIWQEYRRLANRAGEDPAEAERGLRQLLTHEPKDHRLKALCHNDLGVLLAGREENESAKKEFLLALYADPGCDAAKENFGNLEALIAETLPASPAPLPALEPQPASEPEPEPGGAATSDEAAVPTSTETAADQLALIEAAETEGEISSLSEAPNLELPSPPEPSAPRAPKVALVSMLFNWPAGGGGVYDSVAIGKGLLARGVDLQHFYITVPWMGIGEVEGQPPLPGIAIPAGEGDLTADTLKSRVREIVEKFAPDKVLITDSWNFKPHLLEALKDFPCYLRYHAMESLCPLNNIRYLPRQRRIPYCRYHFLATPEKCLECLKQNRPSCGSLHNWDRNLSRVEESGFYPFLRNQLEGAAGAFVNNPIIAAMLSPYLPECRVVTSGVNTAALYLREAGDPPVKTLLMSGMAREGMKGFAVLWEAGKILRRTRQDFRILITAREIGPIDEYTSSVGWHSQEMLPELYAQADICIVPSVCEEAFGIVAAEAMAAGRPVIASRVGGLQFSVVDGITGLLFEPGNAEELAEKIALLLDDPALRRTMGAAGRERAKQYDWENIIEKEYAPVLGGE